MQKEEMRWPNGGKKKAAEQVSWPPHPPDSLSLLTLSLSLYATLRSLSTPHTPRVNSGSIMNKFRVWPHSHPRVTLPLTLVP